MNTWGPWTQDCIRGAHALHRQHSSSFSVNSTMLLGQIRGCEMLGEHSHHMHLMQRKAQTCWKHTVLGGKMSRWNMTPS